MEKETGAAVDAVLAWLAGLRVGEGSARGGMVIFPLKHSAAVPAAGGAFAYCTLAEGLAEGWVEVREQASATVPELLLRNLGKVAVLVLDGEEVVGGRQNRIANASFLVAPGATIAMPVSCVEAGRWHSVSDTFSAGESVPASLKREKQTQVRASLRATGRPVADQGEIWDHVARREAEFASGSATGALHDIYKAQGRGLAEYEEAFPYPEGALGLLVALSGRMVGGDAFDRPETARALWGKLVRSYALDALNGKDGTAAREAALRFLGRMRGAYGESYPSLGLGEDVRLEGLGAEGAALVYGRLPVHVSLFRAQGRSASGGLASASTRRHLRHEGRVY